MGQGHPVTVAENLCLSEAPAFSTAPPGAAWTQGQWPAPWHFRNPWGFSQPSRERRSVSGIGQAVSDGLHPPPDTDVTLKQTPQSHLAAAEVSIQEAMEVAEPLVPTVSSSSPEEAIAGLSPPVPQDDTKAHQELLKRVTSNLGL